MNVRMLMVCIILVRETGRREEEGREVDKLMNR